jgi:hypothetical protein
MMGWGRYPSGLGAWLGDAIDSEKIAKAFLDVIKAKKRMVIFLSLTMDDLTSLDGPSLDTQLILAVKPD